MCGYQLQKSNWKRIVINNQTKEEVAFSLHKDAPILTVKKKKVLFSWGLLQIYYSN